MPTKALSRKLTKRFDRSVTDTTSTMHLTKEHNCANVIALSYKQDINELVEMIREFIETECSTEERHLRRVNKIINYEQGE